MAPFLTTHAVKSHSVLGLKSALEHLKVKLLDHDIQKKELLAFDEKGSTNGSFSNSAPLGLHYDGGMRASRPTPNRVMALATPYRGQVAWPVTTLDRAQADVTCIRMATCGRSCSDACSKMNGLPAMVIRAGDPIEEIDHNLSRDLLLS